MPLPKGRAAIAIRKYGFLLPPAVEEAVDEAEEEEQEENAGAARGQPSTQQALISHLDVIYCGLHRENSVYCNRDHNYHRSALSQDLSRVRVRLQMLRVRGLCSGCVCLQGDICACINGLTQRKQRLSKSTFIWTLTSLLSLDHVFFHSLFQAAPLNKEEESYSHNQKD